MEGESVQSKFQEIVLLEEGEKCSDVNKILGENKGGTVLKAASEVHSWTNDRSRHQQTWWWNNEVGKRVSEKRIKYQTW